MAGRAGGLAGVTRIRPLLVTVVIKRGERHGGGAGRPREREMYRVVGEDSRVRVEQRLAQIVCRGGSIRRGKIHRGCGVDYL